MRFMLAALGCLGLLGCAAQPAPKTAALPVPDQTVSRADCYTVELFNKSEGVIRPAAKGVPPEHAALLGNWGQAAWNDQWCHDLLVTQVHNDGTVDLVEMHGPYEPFGAPASAFKRKARIDENGNLRLAYGTETITYQLRDGRLIGYREGLHGKLQIAMRRRGDMRVPLSKPVALAAAAAAESAGGTQATQQLAQLTPQP